MQPALLLRSVLRPAAVLGAGIALAACASGRSGVPVAALPTEAVSRMLGAAQTQDLRALMQAWGTREKTVAEMARKDRSWQLRGETLLCVLQHDSSQVRPRTIRSDTERRLAVTLFQGRRALETTVTTVQTRDGGWRVYDVDVQPLLTACQPRGRGR